MFKVGLSTSGNKLGIEGIFEQYKNAGIKFMEVSTNPETLDYDKTKKLAEENGIILWSFHLPFLPFDKIDISNPKLCDYTVEYFKELIKKATDMGPKVMVIHPSGEPIEEEDRKARMECAKESLRKLQDFANTLGATIAVEDLPRTCLGRNSSDILDLISAHPDLRVCFDTNHLLAEPISDFIKAVGDKIITTHVSDYDFINERHWIPGEGKIDWQELIGALKEVGYKGPWLYEMGFKCPNTIYRDRDITCEDFSRNAKELFAGEKPTIFSTPKPNLGMWE